MPAVRPVKLLFYRIHLAAHVGQIELEHFCELSGRAKHVRVLLEGLRADGFGEEKLTVHYRANAAIHNKLSLPPTSGISVDRLLGYLAGAVLVHVVLFAALLVDDAVGRDVGPDHIFLLAPTAGLR